MMIAQSRYYDCSSIYRHFNLFAGLKLSLDGFVHSFSFCAGNPDFTALVADLNRDFFKEVEMVFYKPVNCNFLNVEFASADSTQGVFHCLFSLLNKLLMDLFEHLVTLYHKDLALSRNNRIAFREIGTGRHNNGGLGFIFQHRAINFNVGIGTTSPGAYKLNVAGGDMYVSGNIVAGGAIGGVTPQTIQKIDLTPEFPTAILKGTGNGVMTSSFDTTAGAYHSYYNWTGNTPSQAYDIYVRVLVPEDFGTWDTSAAITYYTNIDATPGNTGVTLTVYDTGDNTSFTGTKVQDGGWAVNTVGSASLTGTYADGDWITLKFTMTADSAKNAKLGEVTLKYNRE